MLDNVFVKTLRDLRRGLIGWGAGIAATVGIMGAIWPTVRDMPDMESFLENYPEVLRELFNFDEYMTASGYLNAELFSFMVPAMFLVFGIMRGARLVAGEEELGTLEVLLSTPVSRRRVLLHKAAALVVSVVVLGAVLFVSTALVMAAVGADASLSEILVGATSVTLLGVEFGLVALAVGASTGSRAWALGASSALAVGSYLLFAIAKIVDAVEPYEILSPFYQTLDAGPMGGGFRAAFLWTLVVGAVAIVAALPLFDRRDVPA